MLSKNEREQLIDRMMNEEIALPIQRKEDGWWLMAIPCKINGHTHEISCMSRYSTKFGNYGYRFVLDRYTEEIDMSMSFTVNNDGLVFSYNDFSDRFKEILIKLHTIIDALEDEYGDVAEIDLLHPVTVKL